MKKSEKENRLNSVGRVDSGRFAPLGDEPLGKTIGFRLPVSLESELDQFLQQNKLNKREVLTKWIRNGLDNS
jgi:hypothetical protein